MKARRTIGPFLFWSIAGSMGLAVLLVAFGLRMSQQRAEVLAQRTLDHIVEVTGTRLDENVKNYASDLEHEAAFLAQFDSLPLRELLQRWKPLMSSRWAITAIHQSNTYGAELSLLRTDAGWEVRTRDTTLAFMPLIIPPHTHQEGPSGMGMHWVQDTLVDPRQAVWFSRALEDRTGGPIWSSDPANVSLHHLSMLVRPDSERDPFRVIAFTIDVRIALAANMDGEEDVTAGPILLDSDGRDLIALADPERRSPLEEAAIEHWRSSPGRSMFTGIAGDHTFHALVLPHALNGETLHLGAVVDDELLEGWIRPERVALGLCGLFLLLLAVLLTMSYVRRLRESDLLRQQEKRTRSRERELAKALGEREVLDREVHHRVKNNLQVVSSLLNLQAQRIPEGPARAEFVRGKRRIDAMALVHHKLYGMQDLRTIRLQDLFKQLADAVSALHEPRSRAVSHTVETAGIVSDPDTAIELGIILCELLDNCHQHAFPYATGGHIEIAVRQVSPDLYRLTVQDNGKGMDPEARNDPSKLGLEIVDALAGQLDGSFAVRPREDGAGVVFDVQFRMLHPLN